MPKKFKVWSDVSNLVPEARAIVEAEAELIGPDVADLARADVALAGPILSWDGALFDRAPRLQSVSRSGIGYDNIDVDAATARNICVTNAPEAPTIATAEFTIALLLSLTRKIALADRRFKTEGWMSSGPLTGVDLAGKKLGLVGLGRIGRRVAAVARALQMNVVAFDPFLTAETVSGLGVELMPDLPSLLKVADFVSLHIPMSRENKGLIGAAELALMKKGSFLVNAARGPVVVPEALVAALRSGHLAGAALDVWDPEPATRDNPLLQMDNVVATPHIAAATAEGRVRNNTAAARCAMAILRGEKPPSLVNPEIWERRRR